MSAPFSTPGAPPGLKAAHSYEHLPDNDFDGVEVAYNPAHCDAIRMFLKEACVHRDGIMAVEAPPTDGSFSILYCGNSRAIALLRDDVEALCSPAPAKMATPSFLSGDLDSYVATDVALPLGLATIAKEDFKRIEAQTRTRLVVSPNSVNRVMVTVHGANEDDVMDATMMLLALNKRSVASASTPLAVSSMEERREEEERFKTLVAQASASSMLSPLATPLPGAGGVIDDFADELFTYPRALLDGMRDAAPSVQARTGAEVIVLADEDMPQFGVLVCGNSPQVAGAVALLRELEGVLKALLPKGGGAPASAVAASAGSVSRVVRAGTAAAAPAPAPPSIVQSISIPNLFYLMVVGRCQFVPIGSGAKQQPQRMRPTFPKLQELELRTHTSIKATKLSDHELCTPVVVSGERREDVDAACRELFAWLAVHMGIPRIALGDLTARAIPDAATSDVYIFVDNSNLSIGAGQFVAGSPHFPDGLPPTGRDNAVRVSVGKLATWLIGRRRMHTGYVVGTMPDGVAAAWAGAGYEVTRTREDEEGHADDLLHARCFQTIMFTPSPAVLVMCTGDGNVNKGLTTFPSCVYTALRQGWRVEVVSWKSSTSRVYPALHAMCPAQLTMRYLDPHHAELCYRKK